MGEHTRPEYLKVSRRHWSVFSAIINWFTTTETLLRQEISGRIGFRMRLTTIPCCFDDSLIQRAPAYVIDSEYVRVR